MADLKIQGTTPVAGKLKLGSSDVSKIYSGPTLVWPTSPGPGQVGICGLIWTDVNSSETELIAGGNIPILTNGVEWHNAYQNQTPAACYWDFDANNASYGFIYNYFAKNLVKPPVGFRLPTPSDFNTLETTPCFPATPPNGNRNRYGANPGNWDPAIITNTTELGDSGFNLQGYGYTSVLSPSQGGIVFISPQRAEGHWTDTASISTIGWGLQTTPQGDLGPLGFSNSNSWGLFIRFVKNA